MTEVKVEYSPDFWQKIAHKERTRADDNLRMAAEKAMTIQKLSEELRAAQAEIARLSKIIGGFEEYADTKPFRLCCSALHGEKHKPDCLFYNWRGQEGGK